MPFVLSYLVVLRGTAKRIVARGTKPQKPLQKYTLIMKQENINLQKANKMAF